MLLNSTLKPRADNVLLALLLFEKRALSLGRLSLRI